MFLIYIYMYICLIFKNRLDHHWKQYQYTLDSITTTRVTFTTDYEEDRNETNV